MIRRNARLLHTALSIFIAVVALGAVGLDSASGAVTLSASPTAITAGTSTTVTWAGIPSPTTKDWIGLYASSGAADTAFTAWRYTDSTLAGSVV